MLKNKKILIILFAFLFLIFIKIDCFAYSYNAFIQNMPDDIKNSYVVARYWNDGNSGHEGEFVIDYYYSESPIVATYNNSSNLYFFTSTDLVYKMTYSSYNNSYETEVYDVISSNVAFLDFSNECSYYSNHDIYYSTGESGESETGIFFQERWLGTNTDNPSTDSEGTGGEGESEKDTERTGFFTSVIDTISNIFSGITQGFKDVIQFIANILSYLNPLDENFILKGVLEFLGNILSYLNPWNENFILKGVLNFLSNIISYINPVSDNFLGKKLVELIGNVLKAIFVPDEENINNLFNIVNDRFSFVENIKSNIKGLQELFVDFDESDNITMNINNKYYSGTVTILNFTWFSQYKSYTDSIITAFIYLFYLWRLFIHLPNIISGLGGDVSLGEQIDDVSFYAKHGHMRMFKKRDRR